MRARIYTSHGPLGLVDLVDGAGVADVVRAMREHRLYITQVEEPAAAPAATTLPAQAGPELTLPGGEALDEQRQPTRRRVRA